MEGGKGQNRSAPLPTAIAKRGIKKSAKCFETVTQLRTPLKNSWLRHCTVNVYTAHAFSY